MSPARHLLYAASWSALLAAGGEALAAEPAPGGASVEVVVVTAQRRAERPEDVPIFLTAASGEQLERLQATDMASLGKIAPGLEMTRTGAFTQPFLRGVGKRSTLGVENSVATYVDGVYLASSIGALLDLRGVERVEVLNGPQGTLFGRNSTGGVIQVVTRDPAPAAGGEAELQGGSDGFVRGDAYMTGGDERLAANLAVSLSRNGGYGTNLFTGRTDQGETAHSLAARSKWVWRPGDRLKLTLAGDYQDIDQDFTQAPAAGFAPIGKPRVQDFRDYDQDGPNRYRFRYGGASLKAEAGIGSLELMSLTAARRLDARYGADQDMGPKLLFSATVAAEQTQVSQELQLQSNAASPLSWQAGLYYIHIKEQYDPVVFYFGDAYAARLGGRVGQILADTGDTDSWAAYGQATVPLGEATRLTGGLRYTIEHRSVEAGGQRLFDAAPLLRPIPGLPLLGAEPLRAGQTERDLSWRAALEQKVSAVLTGFLSASRGFQSGGWNLQTPQAPPFGPERLDDFEAGLKYADRSQRVTAQAAVFYDVYSDLQVSVFSPQGSTTTNAASADIHGVDLQLDARLDELTQAGVGAEVLEARFNSFANATCTDYSQDVALPYAPVACDVTGHRLPFAPRFKANIWTSRQIPLGRAGTLELSANLAYNSGYFSEPDNVVRQTAFATLDASALWRPGRHGLSVRLWALNLTDTDYYDSLVTLPTAGVRYRPAAPRRIGASIARSF